MAGGAHTVNTGSVNGNKLDGYDAGERVSRKRAVFVFVLLDEERWNKEYISAKLRKLSPPHSATIQIKVLLYVSFTTAALKILSSVITNHFPHKNAANILT